MWGLEGRRLGIHILNAIIQCQCAMDPGGGGRLEVDAWGIVKPIGRSKRQILKARVPQTFWFGGLEQRGWRERERFLWERQMRVYMCVHKQ